MATTAERLGRMEEKTDNIDKKLDVLINRIDTFEENLERKFAAKWVQNVVSGLVGLILTTVVVALLAEVVKGK